MLDEASHLVTNNDIMHSMCHSSSIITSLIDFSFPNLVL